MLATAACCSLSPITHVAHHSCSLFPSLAACCISCSRWWSYHLLLGPPPTTLTTRVVGHSRRGLDILHYLLNYCKMDFSETDFVVLCDWLDMNNEEDEGRKWKKFGNVKGKWFLLMTRIFFCYYLFFFLPDIDHWLNRIFGWDDFEFGRN